MQNKLATFLFLSTVFLLVFISLVVLRATDDNSLFSWAWVFARIDASRVYLALVTGLMLSFALSQTVLPARYHVPFLALLSFAVTVPFWGEPETIVDASRYFTQAKHLEVYGIGYFLREWGGSIPAWTDLPLVPFLYGILFKISGEHRLAVQVFTTALFSLTTVLTYQIGKKLWGQDTGFSAGLLLLGIPYLLTQVPLMLVDVPTMFFLTLSLYTYLDAVEHGGVSRIVLSVTAIVMTILTKYSAWFMLSVLIVALLVRIIQRTGPVPIKRGLVILFIAGVLGGALLLLKYDVLREQMTLLREFQRPGLARWQESFLSTFLFQVHPVITASALASVVVAFRKRDSKYLIISWLILLTLLFHITRIRYMLPLFPMLALMASYGLQSIPREDLRRSIVFGTVTTSLVVAFFAYLPFAKTMSAVNLMHAGAYLNTLPGDIIEVVTIAPREPVANPAVSVPLLDLFTDKTIRYHYPDESLLSPEEILRSSLRFTWEYRNPAYYETSSGETGSIPVVVLSSASDGPLPAGLAGQLEGYRLSRSFEANEGVFKYTVGVSVYQLANAR